MRQLREQEQDERHSPDLLDMGYSINLGNECECDWQATSGGKACVRQRTLAWPGPHRYELRRWVWLRLQWHCVMALQGHVKDSRRPLEHSSRRLKMLKCSGVDVVVYLSRLIESSWSDQRTDDQGVMIAWPDCMCVAAHDSLKSWLYCTICTAQQCKT